jgi:hypothetical protein
LDDRGLTSEGRPTAALAVVFAAIAVLTTLDLGFDASGGPKVLHILVEGAVSLAGLVGAAVMARRLWLVVRQGRDAQREAAALAERLKATEAEAARWRSEARDHIEGLKRGSGPSVRPLGALPGREGSRSAAAQRIEPQGAGGGSLDHGGHLDSRPAPSTRRRVSPAAATWPHSSSKICSFPALVPGRRDRLFEPRARPGELLHDRCYPALPDEATRRIAILRAPDRLKTIPAIGSRRALAHVRAQLARRPQCTWGVAAERALPRVVRVCLIWRPAGHSPEVT